MDIQVEFDYRLVTYVALTLGERLQPLATQIQIMFVLTTLFWTVFHILSDLFLTFVCTSSKFPNTFRVQIWKFTDKLYFLPSGVSFSICGSGDKEPRK